MPRLWTDTIEAHRRAVHNATLDATATLVAAHGLSGVTMSAIAAATGIGRATLYKYFPDTEAILLAWHERQVSQHLDHLTKVGSDGASAGGRLEAVLLAYAMMMSHAASAHGQPSGDFVARLHRGAHIGEAQASLTAFITGLLSESARDGLVRSDVPAPELAGYCLSSLGATQGLSPDAIHRLVRVVLAGLRPAED